MIKSVALAGVFASTLAVTAAYGSAFLVPGGAAWAPWFLAVGTAAILVSMMTLGAVRHGRLGRLAWPFAFVFVVVCGGFGVLLALPPADPADPTMWLGLPPRAAVLLYVVGILPMFVVPVAYALTFDEMALTEEDWQRIRRAAPGGSGSDETPVGLDR